jgi:hypothetical protein
MRIEDMLTLYDDLAGKTWQKMIDMIGVHAVKVLVQRAAWMTCQKYTEAELITLSDEGLSFSKFKGLDPGVVKEVAEEFISSLVSILTRLVGTDIAATLAREIHELSNTPEGIKS